MKFNTGNPIGSTDARDLSDNAENFDTALGTTAATWVDRFGVTRDSFEGRLAKGSFYRVGDFTTGYTLTNMRQTLEYGGHEYSWSGTFPKVVAAGATPATSGGIGAGAWVDRTDVTLRSEINVITKTFNTITELKSTIGLSVNDVIETLGYYSANDGGGNKFSVIAASTYTANDGTIVDCVGVQAVAIDSTVLHAKQFGARGYPYDDTDAVINLFSAAKDNCVIDFDGLTINIVHKGVNSNPFGLETYLNRTCYMFMSKISNPTLRNGNFVCNLDMTSNSLVLFGFSGCSTPVFDDIHVNIQCSGIPSFDANGWETFASIISHIYHPDGTVGEGFKVKGSCSFRINHPAGASIGAKEGNTVHDYSGKIVGIESWGYTTNEDSGLSHNNVVENGVKFWECTARCVWMWHTADNYIKPYFYNCGVDATQFCAYGIRVTHRGDNSEYFGKYEGGYFKSAALLVSNNNSPRTPRNVKAGAFAKDVDLFSITVSAGINVSVDGVKLYNCIGDYGLVKFIEQTNSEWVECECHNVEAYNCSTVTVTEGSGIVYNSADNDGQLDIGHLKLDTFTSFGGVTQRYHSNKVHHSIIRNASNYGMYHGTGISPIYEDNEVTDCPNNWGIGGFADANVTSRRNVVKRCANGIRTGVGNSYDDYVEDCVATHISVRAGKALRFTVVGGSSAGASAYGVLNEGSASELIGHGVIKSMGYLVEGIRAPITAALIVGNGLLGTFTTAKITNTAGLIKLNNYNSTGAIV